jgi:malonyl-CoA/methylmalonyl-CoA synthetase
MNRSSDLSIGRSVDQTLIRAQSITHSHTWCLWGDAYSAEPPDASLLTWQTDRVPTQEDVSEPASLSDSWLRRWRQDPGAETLLDPSGVVVTAGELEARSEQVAQRLSSAGVRRRDRVLLSADPSVDLVVAYVALLRLGAVVVPANTGYTRAELQHVVEDAAPVLAVLDDPDRVAGLGAVAVTPQVDVPDAGPVALDQITGDDLAWICYTSGTTGRPKGAMLSHANLLAGARAVIDSWQWTARDRLILALPLFHMHGLGVGINASLSAGASVAILPRFDVDAVLDARRDLGGTLFFGVPTMYARLAESARLPELSEFRLCVCGSAPLAPDLWARVREEAGVEILERYGMTETVMLCSNPLGGPRVPGSVGMPLPGVALRLGVDDVVEVRGPSVFSGYWQRTSATAEAFTEDGWFRTGDVGAWMDSQESRLAIVGRTSELIITGGYNVYPREVEDAIGEHPAVVDVAVVGVSDPTWGEMVVAYLVGDHRSPRPDDSELTDLATSRLAPYKRPRRWIWIDALPRNAMGKVQRDTLRAMLEASVAG